MEQNDIVTMPPEPLANHRILIAEDETLIAMYLRAILSAAGAIVTTVSMVEAAMHKAEDSFDLALLDVSLSDGEIFPAAEKLGSRGVPIVFHSGHVAGMDDLQRFPNAMTLEKPARQSDIIQALVSQLRAREAQGLPAA